MSVSRSRLASSLVWFRRDLRIDDHAALCQALQNSDRVFCAFVYDRDILDPLLAKGMHADRRLEFIVACIAELQASLQQFGGDLILRYAAAVEDIPRLAAELGVEAVYCNHDYEPDAIVRDSKISQMLMAAGRTLLTFKDQVIFEKDEVLSQAAKPFSVFTPYKNAWLKKLQAPGGAAYTRAHEIAALVGRLAPPPAFLCRAPMTLEELGFRKTNLPELGMPTGTTGARMLLSDFLHRIARYDGARDFPAIKGPSYLSAHLRFGTISIRELVRRALACMERDGGNDGAVTWLSELIWRDFYFMILYHHPHVAQRAFKPAYDNIQWRNDREAQDCFHAWCEGRTGYPLVDAAMRQLNGTGYMHNRLRMVTACFLIKDLGIDWKWGEAYFAERLTDFDLAANNGGWQWAASSGCDAQPYFRIFNPVTQSQKFDPEGKFIRRHLPQLAMLSNRHIHAPWIAPAAALEKAGVRLGIDYPPPLVQHDEARRLTLARYGIVKKTPVSTDD